MCFMLTRWLCNESQSLKPFSFFGPRPLRCQMGKRLFRGHTWSLIRFEKNVWDFHQCYYVWLMGSQVRWENVVPKPTTIVERWWVGKSVVDRQTLSFPWWCHLLCGMPASLESQFKKSWKSFFLCFLSARKESNRKLTTKGVKEV